MVMTTEGFVLDQKVFKNEVKPEITPVETEESEPTAE
jgi:hypothetical protein